MPRKSSNLAPLERKRSGKHTSLARRYNGPTSLTDSLIQKLTKSVERCNYEVTAARKNRVPVDTFKQWKARGKLIIENQIEEEHLTKHDIQCAKLYLELERANAVAQEKLVQTVYEEGTKNGNWLAAMTMLERKSPEQFGRNTISRSGSSGDGEIKIHIELTGEKAASSELGTNSDNVIDVTPGKQ